MLRYLLEKEFKQFFRNRFLPRVVIIFPFVALAIFPLVANMEIKNIRLLIVDHDKSISSRRLVDKINSSGYFVMNEEPFASSPIFEKMEKGNTDEILEIPAGFERSLMRESKADLMIYANAVNGMKAALSSAYLSQIIADYNQELRQDFEMITPSHSPPAFEIIPLYLYNPTMKSVFNMIPALLVMMMAMICGFLPALNIVAEKEKGTMEQMNVTPVNKLTFILSKLIPFWIVGFVVLSICIFVAWLFYDFFPIGTLGTLYLFVAVFVFAMSGFGLVVSNYAGSMQQAMFIMFFFVVIFVFLSGLYTPFVNMPKWAQLLGHISPLKYIIEVIRFIYLKGSSVGEMLPQLFALMGLGIFFNGWAVISYKKTNQ